MTLSNGANIPLARVLQHGSSRFEGVPALLFTVLDGLISVDQGSFLWVVGRVVEKVEGSQLMHARGHAKLHNQIGWQGVSSPCWTQPSLRASIVVIIAVALLGIHARGICEAIRSNTWHWALSRQTSIRLLPGASHVRGSPPSPESKLSGDPVMDVRVRRLNSWPVSGTRQAPHPHSDRPSAPAPGLTPTLTLIRMAPRGHPAPPTPPARRS
jgi:hypothetical protein